MHIRDVMLSGFVKISESKLKSPRGGEYLALLAGLHHPLTAGAVGALHGYYNEEASPLAASVVPAFFGDLDTGTAAANYIATRAGHALGQTISPHKQDIAPASKQSALSSHIDIHYRVQQAAVDNAIRLHKATQGIESAKDTKTASGNLFESAMTRIHRAAEDVMDPAPGPISSIARAGKRSLEDLVKSDAAKKANDTLDQLMKKFRSKIASDDANKKIDTSKTSLTMKDRLKIFGMSFPASIPQAALGVGAMAATHHMPAQHINKATDIMGGPIEAAKRLAKNVNMDKLEILHSPSEMGPHAMYSGGFGNDYINTGHLEIGPIRTLTGGGVDLAAHEVGHAKHFNTSKLMSIQAGTGLIGNVAGSAALYFGGERAAKAAPWIVGLSHIPRLIEEGRASYTGYHNLKNVLSKTPNISPELAADTLRQSRNRLGAAFGTYLAGAAGATLTAHILSKYKQKLLRQRAEQERQSQLAPSSVTVLK